MEGSWPDSLLAACGRSALRGQRHSDLRGSRCARVWLRRSTLGKLSCITVPVSFDFKPCGRNRTSRCCRCSRVSMSASCCLFIGLPLPLGFWGFDQHLQEQQRKDRYQAVHDAEFSHPCCILQSGAQDLFAFGTLRPSRLFSTLPAQDTPWRLLPLGSEVMLRTDVFSWVGMVC